MLKIENGIILDGLDITSANLDEFVNNLHLIKQINGNLSLSNLNLTELPDLSNIIIKGDFNCYSNQLTSLIGCPTEIRGSLNCFNNQLTSLIGCPPKIGGDFNCYSNQLTSLIDCPTEIKGSFYCQYNQLISLKGCPTKIGDDFICSYNQLTSLKGCPAEIGGYFDCNNNQLTSLIGCPTKIVDMFYCYCNKLDETEVNEYKKYLKGKKSNFIINKENNEINISIIKGYKPKTKIITNNFNYQTIC